jgi:hypothetical protein
MKRKTISFVHEEALSGWDWNSVFGGKPDMKAQRGSEDKVLLVL